MTEVASLSWPIEPMTAVCYAIVVDLFSLSVCEKSSDWQPACIAYHDFAHAVLVHCLQLRQEQA